MILLVDLCDQSHPLSRDEFVLPIIRIVKACNRNAEVRHYLEITEDDRKIAEGIILCGTALRDNAFITHKDEFWWLQEDQIATLGICAGMQVMTTVWGGSIRKGEEIGMTTIRAFVSDPLLDGIEEFSAYELHSFSPVPPDCFQILAISASYPQIIRHRSLPWYGVLFHPEVRNEWVVERFLDFCREGMD